MNTTVSFGWVKDENFATFYKPATRAQMLRALRRDWSNSPLGLSAWVDAACQNVTGGCISPSDAIRYVRGEES